MEGINELQLNEATICKAIQFWLNRDQLGVKRAVTVRCVTCKDDGYGRTFAVSFEPKAEAKPSK